MQPWLNWVRSCWREGGNDLGIDNDFMMMLLLSMHCLFLRGGSAYFVPGQAFWVVVVA